MRRARWSLLVFLAVVVVAVGVALITGPPTPESIKWMIAARFPRVSWVDAETLAGWMNDDARRNLLLLDVRTKEEYAVSHLRGAVQIDPGGPNASELTIPDDATVVVYCSVGYRSGAIVEELRERGVEQVYNLTGGIFGWANSGRPLFRNDTRVELVHPYDEAWGLLLREDLRAD